MRKCTHKRWLSWQSQETFILVDRWLIHSYTLSTTKAKRIMRSIRRETASPSRVEIASSGCSASSPYDPFAFSGYFRNFAGLTVTLSANSTLDYTNRRPILRRCPRYPVHHKDSCPLDGYPLRLTVERNHGEHSYLCLHHPGSQSSPHGNSHPLVPRPLFPIPAALGRRLPTHSQ